MLQCVERSWKNRDVILPSINIAINAACILGRVSSAWVAAFNLPLRVLNTLGHYHVGPRLAAESCAYALQFDPTFGRFSAIITDILSAVLSYSFRPDDTPVIGETDKDPKNPQWGSLNIRIITVAYRLMRNRFYNTVSTVSSGCVKIVNKLHLVDVTRATEEAVREAVEIAGKGYSKAVVEKTAKELAGSAGHEITKRIPIFSIAVSTMLALHRFSQGQFWRGLGELTSGVASCIPGYGTMASLGLDIVLISMDIREVIVRPSLKDENRAFVISTLPLDLPGAYWILGIDPKTTPGQEQVEEIYHRFHEYLYSDGLRRVLFMKPKTLPGGTQLSGFSEDGIKDHKKSLKDCKDALAKVREILDLENRRIQANARERMRIFFRWGCFHWKTV